MAACMSCKFWQPKPAVPGHPRKGACHRSTPTLTWLNGEHVGLWPVTVALEWCGEYVWDRDPREGAGE